MNQLTNGFRICLEQDINNLTVWKHSLTDYGLAIENTDYIGTPEVETYLVDVPGGKVLDLSEAITGEPVFKQREIKLNVGKVRDTNKTWDKIISTMRNTYHGRRVCISFDTDSEFFYTGRLYIEDFSAKRDLGTFTIRIVAEPYKQSTTNYGWGNSIGDFYTDDATKGEEWWEPLTYNNIYTADDPTRIQGIIMGTITPTQEDYTKYDFDGDGRITARDYYHCKNLVKAVILPFGNPRHSPLKVTNRLPKTTETVTYKVNGTGPTYQLNTNALNSEQEKRNKTARVTIYNSDTKQKFVYLMGANYAQTFPNLYPDINGYIIVECLVSRTNLQAGDTFEYNGQSNTVTKNETLVERIISLDYKEGSL